MTKIDDHTPEQTTSRPWYAPGVHERRDEDLSISDWPAGEGEAGQELMLEPPSIGFRIAAWTIFAVVVGAIVAAAVFG